MKKVVAAFFISSLMMFSTVAFGESTVSVNVNGVPVESEQPPIICNDRVMIPFRAFYNAIGAEVGWNDAASAAVAVKGKDIVSVKVNENVLYKNGIAVPLDTPAVIVNDRTMVPLRAISESLSCDVNWDENTKTVSVTTDIKKHNPVLVSFLENEFEKTEFQIQGNFEYTIENDTVLYSAKNKIKSYAFFDLDSDGEDELVISSVPDKLSDALEAWKESSVVCLSVWDCDNTGKAVNALAKLTLNHRVANKYFIGIVNNELYLLEKYIYTSSGCDWEERRIYKYSDRKFDKVKEIIFRELNDNISKEKYDSLIRSGDIAPWQLIGTISDGNTEKYRIAYDTSYSIDGEKTERAFTEQVLNDFDTNSTLIFSPYSIDKK